MTPEGANGCRFLSIGDDKSRHFAVGARGHKGAFTGEHRSSFGLDRGIPRFPKSDIMSISLGMRGGPRREGFPGSVPGYNTKQKDSNQSFKTWPRFRHGRKAAKEAGDGDSKKKGSLATPLLERFPCSCKT